VLHQRSIPFAVIGAAAMAVHGVSRGTRDVDLLTVSTQCLDSATWETLHAAGIQAETRRGDAADPLAGVVRFTVPGEFPLDLVVGKGLWQERVVARARIATIEDVEVPVVQPAGLVLLKLYAGGPQDAWDIEQLLAGPDREAVMARVESEVAALPPDCRRLWERLRSQ
jgi:hypothetical protein